MSIPKEEEELTNELEYTMEDDVLVINNDHTTESYQEEELETVPVTNHDTPKDEGPIFMEQKYDSS